MQFNKVNDNQYYVLLTYQEVQAIVSDANSLTYNSPDMAELATYVLEEFNRAYGLNIPAFAQKNDTQYEIDVTPMPSSKLFRIDIYIDALHDIDPDYAVTTKEIDNPATPNLDAADDNFPFKVPDFIKQLAKEEEAQSQDKAKAKPAKDKKETSNHFFIYSDMDELIMGTSKVSATFARKHKASLYLVEEQDHREFYLLVEDIAPQDKKDPSYNSLRECAQIIVPEEQLIRDFNFYQNERCRLVYKDAIRKLKKCL